MFETLSECLVCIPIVAIPFVPNDGVQRYLLALQIFGATYLILNKLG